MKYLASIVAGSMPIIQKDIRSRPKDEIDVSWSDDSMMMFTSSLPPSKLLGIGYLSNLYQVASKQIITSLNGTYLLGYLKNGSPSKLDSRTTRATRQQIESQSGLRYETHRAKHSFYLIEREDLGQTLAIKLSPSNKTQDGQLSPALAHIMCMYAGLKHNHQVLDPFAGHGSIPYQAAVAFGCDNVIANDLQIPLESLTHIRIKWLENPVTDLSNTLDQESIDKIITDPPWGHYKDIDGNALADLYTDLVALSLDVLKPGGVLVILSSWDGMADLELGGIETISTRNILVSGKKASLYKLRKPS